MKKNMFKTLLLSILILSLYGCGIKNETPSKQTKESQTSQKQSEEQIELQKLDYKMAELNTYKDNEDLNHIWIAIELNSKGYFIDTTRLDLKNKEQLISGSIKDGGYNVMIYEGFICEDESHNTTPQMTGTLYDYDKCIYTIEIVSKDSINSKDITASLNIIYDSKEIETIEAKCNTKPSELTLRHKYIHSNIPFEVNGNYYLQDTSLIGNGDNFKSWKIIPIKGTLKELSKSLTNNSTKFIMADKETPSTYMKEELKAPDGWNFFARTDKFNENLEIGWEKDNESLDLGIVKKLYKSVLEYTDDEGTMFFIF